MDLSKSTVIIIMIYDYFTLDEVIGVTAGPLLTQTKKGAAVDESTLGFMVVIGGDYM